MYGPKNEKNPEKLITAYRWSQTFSFPQLVHLLMTVVLCVRQAYFYLTLSQTQAGKNSTDQKTQKVSQAKTQRTGYKSST